MLELNLALLMTVDKCVRNVLWCVIIMIHNMLLCITETGLSKILPSYEYNIQVRVSANFTITACKWSHSKAKCQIITCSYSQSKTQISLKRALHYHKSSLIHVLVFCMDFCYLIWGSDYKIKNSFHFVHLLIHWHTVTPLP